MKRKPLVIMVRCLMAIVLTGAVLAHPTVASANFSPSKVITTMGAPQRMEGISKILELIGDNPFAVELFMNYIGEGNNKAYWEEEVPAHIKECILKNKTYQEKLQYVLQNAYTKGHYKVDFISNGTPPSYNESSFDETLLNQPVAFEEGDLYYSVHGINGHLVIGAEHLGNGQFSIWVALSDYYDFDFEYCHNGGWVCPVSSILNLLNQWDIAGHNFTVNLGFTYTDTWQPASPPVSAPPVQQPVSPPVSAPPVQQPVSPPVSAPPVQQPAAPQPTAFDHVTAKDYARGLYDIGSYTGGWKDGKPNGYGILEYSANTKYKVGVDGVFYSASKYEGNWKDGVKSGQGVFTFAGGYKYDGVWGTDGYYFQGYVMNSTSKKYIKQIANGDVISTVFEGEVIPIS